MFEESIYLVGFVEPIGGTDGGPMWIEKCFMEKKDAEKYAKSSDYLSIIEIKINGYHERIDSLKKTQWYWDQRSVCPEILWNKREED